ncbi:unnamed protein product [Rotaria magnacalcarata]|uniref:Cilia- and flagella-associated protein 91 n=2 Tax=Rotaria magnacalcarata TaxID=392030 RepID=A0A814DT25_9BILA|nr:unnamed protein product [Rotaria magnacalcarata]CAF1666304.1 unnamed protein product [Rotaria magnacalcarata]CAF2206512.1 unnamed protein product [Rotaria magnacalcarata]CAF3769025.1 unnamed protein product [Rotaria magnacalcarata]CAF3799430.1 unnamed protein product [Rotaria magnacalcarata]
MATQTQVLKRGAVQPARIHDYLYDPTCSLSGVRDHARETFIAKTSSEQLQAVPVYEHLFSDLRQYPRFAYRIQARDPVPAHVSRQWIGQADAHREQIAISRLFTGNEAFVVPPRTVDHVDVGGRERAKFFRKPLVPFMENIQPLVQLDTGRMTTGTFGDSGAMPGSGRLLGSTTAGMSMGQPATRTQAIQTDYMEREAQTDPYTPEYVVKPGEQPEVLTLATLMYKKGLPAGLAEVEMIERARAKRAWEASLPPLDDPQQWEKRFKMMSDMERQEWLLRENEIEKLQNLRIELLEKMLKDNEGRQHDATIERINRQWSKKQVEREDFVKTNRLHYLRAIRALLRKRSQLETRYVKNDIVRAYTKYESPAYGPLTRNGYFPDKLTDKYLVKSRFLDTYTGLLELESTLPSNALKIRLPAPKRISSTKDGHLKRQFRRERDLENIFKTVTEQKDKQVEEPKPLRFLVKVEKPVPRPPTPGIDLPDMEQEEREKSIIYIQKLLRGRAIQNMMYKNKEERIELIDEMRSTHALQEQDMNRKKLQRQDIQAEQYSQRKDITKEDFIDSMLQTLEGEAIGDTFDYLSKELIRLQEERRIAAFAMLAERQRRLREAEESGLRQVEERRRREQDELFKQMLKMTQNTVDTYLEDIIIESTFETANQEARIEIQQQATAIDEIAHELESKRTQLESESIVAELVHGFLIPEIAKQESRNKVRHAQHKYLLAAHRVIKASCNENLDDSVVTDRSQSRETTEPTHEHDQSIQYDDADEQQQQEQNREYEDEEENQGNNDETHGEEGVNHQENADDVLMRRETNDEDQEH